MLDWPEQTHTSPNNTSLRVSTVPPDVAVSSTGVFEAAWGGSDTLHVPAALVSVLTFTSPTCTSTVEPLVAYPQIDAES